MIAFTKVALPFVDGEWKGENWLGKLWMELRAVMGRRSETMIADCA
jgi:hypothetical protein